MSEMPARCTKCRHVFPSRLLGFDDDADIQDLTVLGNEEPCPRCGSVARPVEGVFNVVGGAVQAMQSFDGPTDVLQELIDRLQKANTAKDVQEAIDSAPEPLQRIARAVLPSNRQDWQFYIGILVALLVWWASRGTGHQMTDEDVKRVAREVIAEATTSSTTTSLAPSPVAPIVIPIRRHGVAQVQPSRNAPCPCGSGKKYKLCHGTAQGQRRPPS